MKTLNVLIWLPIIGIIAFLVRHLMIEKHLSPWVYPINGAYHAIILSHFIIYYPEAKTLLLGLL
jgi:hypothetical protein